MVLERGISESLSLVTDPNPLVRHFGPSTFPITQKLLTHSPGQFPRPHAQSTKNPRAHLTTLFCQTWATATSPTSGPSFYGPCQSRQHPTKPLCHSLHQGRDKRRPRRFKIRVDLWWRLQSRTWIDGFRRSRFTLRMRVYVFDSPVHI